MSNDVWRWVIALIVGVHGIGHILFMPVLAGSMRLQVSGHSWLLTGMLGDGPTKLIASLAGLVVVGLFLAGIGGLLAGLPWWRSVVIVASVVSIVLVLAMWDGIPTSSAFFALMADAVILIALVWAHWPSAGVVGA